MCEMRTCKTCGETKPLLGNFRVAKIYEAADGLKTYYYHSCIVCKNEVQNKKQKKQRAAEREAARQLGEWMPADTSARIREVREVHEVHAACPILGFSLWTGDVPQRLGAW